MATNIDHIMKDSEDIGTEFPKSTSYDCRCPNGLPAKRSIETSPGHYRAVCENCYYDHEYEGIQVYSWTDRLLRLRNMTDEERFNLRGKLYRLDLDWKE
jgi:hypothetical protein